MSLRILLVEDDPVTRKLVTFMLQRANYEVVVAEDGEKGVELWEKGGCDAVLMDVQMPRMDGLEATRLIREKERTSGGRISIIALTAHALKQDEERCLAAGMDGFIPKPIDFSECLDMMRSLIGQRDQES